VFSRQVEALARKGDVLVGLSTSGESPNVRLAFEAARLLGAVTIGLLGRDGGACRGHCDHAVVVPGPDTGHIQEAHLVLIHLILEAVEA
jgi:D-sedoheptulose 7-phosphate isomerase